MRAERDDTPDTVGTVDNVGTADNLGTADTARVRDTTTTPPPLNLTFIFYDIVFQNYSQPMLQVSFDEEL